MVEIIVLANQVACGAIVTGFAIAKQYPSTVYSCEPTPLGRIYRGYGKLRAETGLAPRKGFGRAITDRTEITDVQMNQGFSLWLRVKD